MNEEMENELNRLTQKANAPLQSQEMIDQATYMIWGAAASATRAFEKVTIKVDTNNNRIYLSIKLRWLFRHKRFAKLHEAWLKRAEGRCKQVIPEGFRLLIYYET